MKRNGHRYQGGKNAFINPCFIINCLSINPYKPIVPYDFFFKFICVKGIFGIEFLPNCQNIFVKSRKIFKVKKF